MIRPGFLDSESRRDLIDLARDGSAEHRLARRANALLLLDQGMSCQSIAAVLFLDGDTIRWCPRPWRLLRKALPITRSSFTSHRRMHSWLTVNPRKSMISLRSRSVSL
jgi:hypothetical protein